MNHLSRVHAVTHNDVANLYVARAHFSAPIRSLALIVSVDVLDRKGKLEARKSRTSASR
jgi:hypothetical protein